MKEEMGALKLQTAPKLRLLSQDPIGQEAQDTNLYRYVFNGPSIHTDPSGEILPALALGVVAAGMTASNIANAPEDENAEVQKDCSVSAPMTDMLLTGVPIGGASILRRAYVSQVRGLAAKEAAMRAAGASAEEIAQAMVLARNALKLNARGGLFNGLKTPTYETLKAQGKNYEQIIKGAKKTNEMVDWFMLP